MSFPDVENKPADLAEVHLLTGINGTGKTRLLAILAAFLGQPEPLLRRSKGLVGETKLLLAGGSGGGSGIFYLGFAAGRGLGGGGNSEVADWLAAVPAFAYTGTAYVVDANPAPMAAVTKPGRGSALNFSPDAKHSQGLLQGIMNLKVQAAMDLLSAREAAPASRSGAIIGALEEAVTEITGRPFAFGVATYPEPRLTVRWGPDDEGLPFDVLPDGLRSIIGWFVDAAVMLDVWLDGKQNIRETEAVFLLDEIESHLHPAWQRRVLPAFQKMFPKAQVFVATHSPFVISSVNHGWIHVLKSRDDGTVAIHEPRAASQGDSYISVLEDVMGLPEWYDPETEGLLAEFRKMRDEAYKGDAGARQRAGELARQIGGRSMELGYTMGQELAQMDRQLAKPALVLP